MGSRGGTVWTGQREASCCRLLPHAVPSPVGPRRAPRGYSPPSREPPRQASNRRCFRLVCSNIFSLFAFLNPECGFHPVLELQGVLEPGGSVNTCYLLRLRNGWDGGTQSLTSGDSTVRRRDSSCPPQCPPPRPTASHISWWREGESLQCDAAWF